MRSRDRAQPIKTVLADPTEKPPKNELLGWVREDGFDWLYPASAPHFWGSLVELDFISCEKKLMIGKNSGLHQS
jgi:hypothetical protein